MGQNIYQTSGKFLIWNSVVLLSVTMLFLTPPCFARNKKTVVLLETMPVPAVLEHSRWFLDELENLGYIPGKTLDLIRFNADGDREKTKNFLSRMLSEKKPDLVVTNATLASQEAMPFLQAINIPQLFFTVADPVGAGLIREVGIPTGSNMTGRVYSLDRRAKIKNILRLVGQLPLKKPLRFGFIHSTYPSSMDDISKLSKAAQSFGEVRFVPYRIQYEKVPKGIPEMLAQVKKAIHELEDQVDFWWEPVGPLGELHEYDQLLHQLSSHPVAFSNTLEGVKTNGSLLYMSPDAEKYGRETAAVAHAILSGTPPGDIPATTPEDFLLAFNLKTALKLNIIVPSDMFELAGRHIYK